ncbi:MAG: hypothetical protein WAV31_02275 [Candidatus Moraniibacteriota bacterium]
MRAYKEIPFFSNTADDKHCFQASLKMIMKYFWPSEDYSWKELEKITAKIPRLWTWQMAGLIWLQEKGVEVKNIEMFDYEKFIQLGGKYLIEEYGEEVGKRQIENSDIEQEKKLSKKFIEIINTERRIPNIDDIKQLLLDDYLIITNINSRILNNRYGYTGHSVVLKGFSGEEFIINDPGGAPGIENRKVDFELFEKAWGYPNEKAKNIMAFKLKK